MKSKTENTEPVMNDSVVVQKPAGQIDGLMLLFHGVGATAVDMAPLGQAIAAKHPMSMVVSVTAPLAFDLGRGSQWFSVAGVTESNRAARVSAAMPSFLRAVRHWQATAGVDAGHTCLIGFSQGAIMSLESTQLAEQVAGRVLAIAGRFATPIRLASTNLEVHLIHGFDDRVIPGSLSYAAYEQLLAVGVRATVDILPALGHAIDARVVRRVLELLQGNPP